MTISALIPNFNYESYVQDAIQGVLQQTHPVAHLFILDDGSTDRSVGKIEEAIRGAPNVTFLRHAKNLGIYPTIEELISLVKTEYLMVVASDDYVMPNFCEEHLRCFHESPRIGLSCSIPGLFQGTIPSQSLSFQKPIEIYSPGELAELIQATPFWIACNTSVHRTAAVKEFGGFKSEAQLHNDWILNYLIGFTYGIGFVPKSLAVARVHPRSMSISQPKTEKQLFLAYDYILQQIHKFPKQKSLFKHSGALNNLGHKIQSYIRKTPAYWEFFPAMQKRRIRLKWKRWREKRSFRPEHYETLYFCNGELSDESKIS